MLWLSIWWHLPQVVRKLAFSCKFSISRILNCIHLGIVPVTRSLATRRRLLEHCYVQPCHQAAPVGALSCTALPIIVDNEPVSSSKSPGNAAAILPHLTGYCCQLASDYVGCDNHWFMLKKMTFNAIFHKHVYS